MYAIATVVRYWYVVLWYNFILYDRSRLLLYQ